MAGHDQSRRRNALRIFRAALAAADPKTGIRSNFKLTGSTLSAVRQRYALNRVRRIFVVGAGKASANMAVAVEGVLKDRITAGLVNTKYGHRAPLHRIRLNECGHPVPDEAGVRGALAMADIVAGSTVDDLVICLLSGGASALLPLPAEGITLQDKRTTTSLLLDCGANIHEINAVRKHISAIKGGQLARLAYPAAVLSLILSDVVGDDLDVIGSGLTAPDRTTFQDALDILHRYGVMEKVPRSVLAHLQQAQRETPRPGDPVFERVQNLIVGSNRQALEAAAQEAKRLGYRPLILSSFIEGETADVARVHAAIAREIVAYGRPVKLPACVLSGGETTVTIRGDGKGGRNQHFALAGALDLDGLPEVGLLSAGTDGSDGPTDAAGAYVDGSTIERARRIGLDGREYLDRNDSYSFFAQTGDLVKTGPTGTNVMDVRVLLAGISGQNTN